MEAGTLIGYFVKHEEARSAWWKLERRGFQRIALVHKTAHGAVHTWDPFLWRRAFGVLVTAILGGALADLVVWGLQRSAPPSPNSLSMPLWFLAGTLVGALFGVAWLRRSKYGVERKLFEAHARWLVADETVLILRAPIEALELAVAVLRKSGEAPPAIFVLHPPRPSPAGEDPRLGAPLSPAELQEQAQRLAATHQTGPRPRRNAVLLQRLKMAQRWIHQAHTDLAAAGRLERNVPPTAEWLLDNEFILESNARDIKLNLPRRFSQELPALVGEPYKGLPRIYSLAQALVVCTELRLDRENIVAFIDAYQAVRPLTIGELWAIPQMFRIALIEAIQPLAASALTELRERESADFWANRLITTNRRDSSQLFAILAELAETQPDPSPYFAAQLVDHLYDEEAALVLVESWLERIYRKPLSEFNLREQNRQTKEQIAIGNAFTSLRHLAGLDWRLVVEQLSYLERALQRDPAGIYGGMDFDTRDRYRRVIEDFAFRSGRTEDQVVQQALALATKAAANPALDERWRHIGTYLIGGGRGDLVRVIHGHETIRYRIREWAHRHHTAVYLGGLIGLSGVAILLLVGIGMFSQPLGLQLLIAGLLMLPVSQLVLDGLNYLVSRWLPPQPLPKLDFKPSGIPDVFRTLVVVPMLLEDAATVRAEVEKLEIRYLANTDANLLYSLFTDYTDADEVHREDDETLLAVAIESLEALNQRYGEGRFYLFHRGRSWSESEQQYIGWERKRGKLEELNRLIDGTRPEGAARIVYVGDPEQMPNVRFVITLDSDTQLPLGTARRLVETLAHPLNQPRFDAAGRVLEGTYTLIQPRVSPSLPSTSASPFSRLFADAVGIDPYTRAVSDVHQDLTGEGDYHGKGIYDVRAFSRVLSGRFPEALLLSHDLIEGAHVRVGLASDIELYDAFPGSYRSYVSRQHRWMRGDWQIAEWVLPQVPGLGKGHGPNQLSAFNRWKIFDNLRRSLVPAASLGLLLAAWLISPAVGGLATLVIGLQLLFRPLAQPFTQVTTHHGLRGFSFPKVGHDLLRAGVDAALLPHQAGLALDAIGRVAYRRLVSHRGLLQWNSTQGLPGMGPHQLPAFVLSMGVASLFSLGVGWAVLRWMPANLALASPWLVAWFLSPLIGWCLNLRSLAQSRPDPLREKDRRFLRQVARRTWRFFSDLVGTTTSWLPPDNYQVSHRIELAMRTSPTNIGLWLLSVLAAHDFGYLTVDEVIEKLTQTLQTLGKLERYEGHLLNWYDIQTLAPLEPRYVSAVDSGNLLAALWTLEPGLGELFQKPVLDELALAGLRDTGEILKLVFAQQETLGLDRDRLEFILRLGKTPPPRLAETLRLLRQTRLAPLSAKAETAYWVEQLEKQIAAWLTIADRYLGWIELLAQKTAAELAPLGAEAVRAIQQDLARAPSLADLAHGRTACIPLLQAIQAAPAAGQRVDWLDRVLEAFAKSSHLAAQSLGQGEALAQAARALSSTINMGYLYNADRRLFSIGYNVSEGRLDNSYYDLLASESRLGSFVAVARGDVPMEHWFALGRPYTAIGRRRVLLSWTGTMFEYLMPLIFQRAQGNTLLADAMQAAVSVQQAYGRQQQIPWGISESAFGDLDLNQTYQYQAFGVPALALKQGLETQIVVAPYATLLAVGLAPRAAVQNLRRLAGLGLLSQYGYFEAIDFSRQPGRDGTRGVFVRTYMAHHQGMGFLALANYLQGNLVQRWFRTDPRVRAVEALLHERIPNLPPQHYLSTRERVPSAESIDAVAPSVSKFTTPQTRTPKTQLLSNGRYGVMITNAGGGYSQWGDFEITRWRSDPTRDAWGTFCYLHDPETDRVWCNTYQPTGGKVEGYSAHFALDRAVFHRVDNGLYTETEIVVSPEDDVEIRRITLVNRSTRTRRLDLTSYIELSLAPHNADRQHPAFNKLFIQTEAVPEQRALLAYRRPRSKDETPIYVAHRLTVEAAGADSLQFETDRRSFIGRGRTLVNPLGSFQAPGNSQGFVLDPILSLRQSLTLGPGQRLEVSLVLAAGETREHVLQLMGKYGDPRAIERAAEFAWASAQLELRVLRLQPDEARRFQQLASHLLFSNPLLRASAERLTENRKGQAGLWPYGISGDLPIALVAVGEARDVSLVRQMLQAHTYWRLHGFKVDLVIFNEEVGGYDQPLHERLEALIRTYALATERDQPGGIFLRSADKISEADQTLLTAAASVVLVAARGSLPQQLGVSTEVFELPEPLVKKRASREPSAPLPFLELPYFNGLGGFTPDGREYAIYLGPEMHTPAPWVNVIANSKFGTLVSETGAGFTWQGNSQRNRLTAWSNDPVLDPPSEVVYIRDEETGVYWTPTATPIREETAYRARHGAGYTVFEHNSHGIEQELTVFVPMDEAGGQPIKLQRLRLRNGSARRRKLSVMYYAEWTLGENRETSQMHVVTEWDNDAQVLLARNRYHPEYGGWVAFAGLNPPAKSYSGNRTTFVGRNGSLSNPAGMERIRRSRRAGAGLDPCAVLQVELELAPGETMEITCMLGQAESVAAIHKLVSTYRSGQALESALNRTKAWWDQRLGVVEVHTPELATDFLINRWLLYQSLSCRIWGRSGFYQSGGAFGFRDQLQDVMALSYAHPALAREHILLAASRQFVEGDVQHWWHPPSGLGTRTRISDDLLWLPYVVAHYVRTTGDVAILQVEIPFLAGPVLKDDQHESIFTPEVAAELATLFEHCRRAVTRGLTQGAHGLPLMGTGDWNDGMNLVGARGQGESVWLAWFLAEVLQGMAELSERLNQPELSHFYQQERETLLPRIEGVAWDGEWYVRAISDEGVRLGSGTQTEARIDSLPQSWAGLSGAEPARAEIALASAWKELVLEDEGLALLFTPPFDKMEPSPGYIQGYPPGVRENGGQYTHAALWLAMALARRGHGSQAAQLLRLLNPVEHARDPKSVARYGLEPYVIAADVYRLPGRIGYGGWSWYTGSAAWMYRTWVEEILGFHQRGDELKIDPVIPAGWASFQLRYRHGEAVYEIQVENPDGYERGVAWVTLDGQRIPGGAIPLERNLVTHRILVHMGKPEGAV
jgi:cyclic beta-1,2-glucan synthetase